MEIQNQNSGHEEMNTTYRCAMKCEGDKVYNYPGNCPVCNMKLVHVGDKSSHGGHHHHRC